MFGYGDRFYTNFGGSAASFLGVSIYGRNSDTWWHRYIIKPLWNVGYKFYKIRLWFMYRFSKEHRYHIIDTGLEPRYYDIDQVMLHGMFALLDRYIEDENEGADAVEKWGKELSLRSDGMSAHYDQLQGERELEAVALYRWWHETRPSDEKRRGELMEEIYHDYVMEFEKIEGTEFSTLKRHEFSPSQIEAKKELDALERKIENEEQEMLHRLINIRGGLWT